MDGVVRDKIKAPGGSLSPGGMFMYVSLFTLLVGPGNGLYEGLFGCVYHHVCLWC